MRQLRMGLRLYFRQGSALFWGLAFPVLMLLGLGAVFSGQGEHHQVLKYARAAAATPDEDQLAKALLARGLRLERVAVDEAERQWKAGKLPALLDGDADQLRLRVNSYLVAQGFQLEAQVQQAYLATQAQRQGIELKSRVAVDLQSPGGHRELNYAAFLLPGLLDHQLSAKKYPARQRCRCQALVASL